MTGSVEVLGGMLILRVITATHVPTDHADAQIYPGIAHTQAFQAALSAGQDILNLIPVAAHLRLFHV